jgi:hypothetical protein
MFLFSFLLDVAQLAYFPHINGLFTTVKSRFDRMCADLDSKLDALRKQTQGDAKIFAKEVQKFGKPFAWIFFECRKSGAQSVREVFAGAEAKNIDYVMTQFEKDENAKGGNPTGENVKDYAFSGAKKREKDKRENVKSENGNGRKAMGENAKGENSAKNDNQKGAYVKGENEEAENTNSKNVKSEGGTAESADANSNAV